jgi:4-amino-4-deoxy-L-arabinose transferase-like glycosyltransferase
MSVGGRPTGSLSKVPARWVSIGIETLAVALLVMLHVSASLWSASRESATYDEVHHIGPGYARLALHDYRLTPIAAPLMPMLAGLGVNRIHPRLPVEDPSWEGGHGAAFGYRFLYGNGDARRLLWLARLPFVALSAALALAVFLWGKQLWGNACAFGALFLYAINPELLAHSHYANLDLGISLVTTLGLWSLYSFLRSPTLGRGALTVAAFAVAPVTKYSFPLVFLMGAAVALASLLDKGIRDDHGGAIRLSRQLLVLAVAVVMAAWLVVWAAFGFKTQEGASPDLDRAVPIDELVREAPLSALLDAIRDRRLLPDGFVHGIAETIHLPRTNQMTFFHGRTALRGWWYYFPLVLILKTPIPLLLLLASTPLLRGPEAHARLALVAVALPAAVYLAFAMSFGFSIGHRHLLPLLPLLCVCGGRQVAAMWARPRLQPIAVLLLSFYALGTYRVAPHFLSFFNEFAGGPELGYRYLVDSNCDWGQDLEELARLCRRLGLRRVKLSYFGNASPDDAGVPYLALPGVYCCWLPRESTWSLEPGDVVAVSVTNLMGVYSRLPGGGVFPIHVSLDGVPRDMPFVEVMTYLQQHYRPFARAGYSILLFRLDPSDRIDPR